MTEPVLFVDDDENLLQSYQRTLRKAFRLETALGGEAGLAALARGPFAVIVSDMRMPGMSGVEFFTRVRPLAPDSVRIMLTGQADLQAAMDAINEGNIFRFLTKPCSPELLAQALAAGVRQYRLVVAERDLLEKTLRGSIKLLTDILALANPEAFSRADRLKRYVQHMARELRLAEVWQFELAAVFSQIGCITVPADTLQKYYSGRPLAPEEKTMVENLPQVSSDLLANIPRLEGVAAMIARLQETPKALAEDLSGSAQADLGASLLRAAGKYDEAVSGCGLTHQQAILDLQAHDLDPRLVLALENLYQKDSGNWTRRQASIFNLLAGMILDEDVQTKRGLLLVAKGQSVSETLIKSLANYLARGEIVENVYVLSPQTRA